MWWVGLWRCRRGLINRRGWDHVVRESCCFITICLIRTNKCGAAAEAPRSKSPDRTPRLLFTFCAFFTAVLSPSVFAATQTRQPGEPDRGVPPQTEAPPGVWVLRPHGAHRAGPPSQGVSCVLLSSERLAGQCRCLLVFLWHAILITCSKSLIKWTHSCNKVKQSRIRVISLRFFFFTAAWAHSNVLQ